MKLTARQDAFIDQMLICKSGAEAARRAGYSEKTAHQIAYENLRKPEVMAVLTARKAAFARQTGFVRSMLIREILEGVSMAKEHSDASTMLRGWLSIAHMLGLDQPEREKEAVFSESLAFPTQYSTMSDNQLIAIAEGRILS